MHGERTIFIPPVTSRWWVLYRDTRAKHVTPVIYCFVLSYFARLTRGKRRRWYVKYKYLRSLWWLYRSMRGKSSHDWTCAWLWTLIVLAFQYEYLNFQHTRRRCCSKNYNKKRDQVFRPSSMGFCKTLNIGTFNVFEKGTKWALSRALFVISDHTELWPKLLYICLKMLHARLTLCCKIVITIAMFFISFNSDRQIYCVSTVIYTTMLIWFSFTKRGI